MPRQRQHHERRQAGQPTRATRPGDGWWRRGDACNLRRRGDRRGLGRHVLGRQAGVQDHGQRARRARDEGTARVPGDGAAPPRGRRCLRGWTRRRGREERREGQGCPSGPGSQARRQVERATEAGARERSRRRRDGAGHGRRPRFGAAGHHPARLAALVLVGSGARAHLARPRRLDAQPGAVGRGRGRGHGLSRRRRARRLLPAARTRSERLPSAGAAHAHREPRRGLHSSGPCVEPHPGVRRARRARRARTHLCDPRQLRPRDWLRLRAGDARTRDRHRRARAPCEER